jgi:hypothetical protein
MLPLPEILVLLRVLGRLRIISSVKAHFRRLEKEEGTRSAAYGKLCRSSSVYDKSGNIGGRVTQAFNAYSPTSFRAEFTPIHLTTVKTG